MDMSIGVLHLNACSNIWCDFDGRLQSKWQSAEFKHVEDQIQFQIDHPEFSNRSDKWLQVVVHIVLRDAFLPISEAQVIHQIDVLNNDFAGKGENVVRMDDQFRDLNADTGLHFCLASIDPEGNPTNGITYTTTTVHDIGLQTGPQG